jgi:hypothetical protein
MLTKQEKKFMQIEELHKLLEDHDFYYVYSDDGKVYDKGKASQEKIDVLIKEIGIKGKNMYKQYMLMQ